MASKLTRYIVKIRHLHAVKHHNRISNKQREEHAEKIRVVMDALWDGLTPDEQLAARHVLAIDGDLELALMRAMAAEAKVQELASQLADDVVA
jgi:hypothetical protein